MKKSLENKKASLVIACRNEIGFISDCLDSVIAQKYPSELMEVLVIDGMSDDGTADILKEYEQKYPNIKVLKNKKITQQYAFNMGIKSSDGEYIFIMGAHSKYPHDYVSRCLEYAHKYKVDNVGGRIEARSKDSDIISRAIIGAYTSSFGVGNATFRKKPKNPVYVDTVFGGCYKREVFDRIGLYNEELKRSQDMELNLRLIRAGGRILLVPDIVSYYYPKTNLLAFIRYNYMAGRGPVNAVHITQKPLKVMHYIPALFVLGLFLGLLTFVVDVLAPLFFIYIFILFIYLIVSVFSSLFYALQKKDFFIFFVLPFIFFSRHLSYGLGSLVEVLGLIFKKKV